MQFKRHTIGFGLVTLLVLVALGATAATASPAASATNTAPVVGALDDPGKIGPPADHCEGGTRIPLPDGGHDCSYTPCDATCVDPESVLGAYVQ